MGLLNRLLKRLQKNENAVEPTNTAWYNFLFDWFNENNDNVEHFLKDFLHPCIEIYKTDERTKNYIENYPDPAYKQYFNQHAILYLAANYPDNHKFKLLFDYLMNKERRLYEVKDSLTRSQITRQLASISISHWETIRTGEVILKIYHAIHDKRDINFSYLSRLSSHIKPVLYPKSKLVFTKVMNYLVQQRFDDKLYVLANSIPTNNLDAYESDSIARLEKEKEKALSIYNTDKPIHISEELAKDCNDTILNIERIKAYQETDYKKRKYLSLKHFPEVSTFIKKYSPNKAAILKYYVYQMGLSYLSRDLAKIHKGFAKELCKDIQLNKEQFLSILNTRINSNHVFIYSELFAPILANDTAINNCDEQLVNRFETKLLKDTIHDHDPIRFQPAFEAILSRRKNSMEPIKHSLEIAKYNQLYGEVSFKYDWIKPNIHNKKQGNVVFQLILDRLNYLFPSSLKSISKYVQYIANGQKLVSMNIDGVDYDFTDNLFVELNQILSSKKMGYRFLPILIQNREYYQHRTKDSSLYKCAVELLNQEQFKVYKSKLPKEIILQNYNLIKDIHYLNQATEIFNPTSIKKASTNIYFQNNPIWKWFKEDYIDQLESAGKWYDLMDLLIQCKGSSKPNKQWSKEINKAIIEFGKERYFKELGSLITTSLKESFWFLDQYRTPIKGIIWSCALHPNDESLSIIKSIVEVAYTKIPGVGPKSAALGNLGLNAFVLSGNDKAFGIMSLMRNKSKYQRFIKALDKSLDKYIATSTDNPEELADKTIPTFGFKDGKRTSIIDNKLGNLFFIKNRKLTKKWIVDGQIQTSAPTLIKENYKSQEKEIAADFKRINGIYKQLKDRIKTYWLYDRKWEHSNWLSHIINHPLLQSYLIGMIWLNETNGKTFLYTEGKYLDFNDQKVSSESHDIISLWHPITSNSQEISSWQKYIYTKKINQPLRQVFREHYPFSTQESNQLESERFAHHFLVVKKLMAVANASGWTFAYEHEGNSWPRKFIRSLNLTVHLRCDYSRTDYAIPTKELYFTKGNSMNLYANKKVERIALSTVPLKTRSEVCRDMDLFIATTSIANDPELSLKTEDQKCYREDFNKEYFSDNASAKIRKQVIEVIAPSLGFSPVFDKNYLVIQGKLNKYRINLGSGFAQLADSQRHVNLLPDIEPMKKSKKIHTPIQDDETLYVLLAKALFLVNDNKITDPIFINAITG